ncbi:response regulator [Caldithrix abyssi]
MIKIKPKILLIDDDLDIQETIRALLKNEKYEVYACSTVKEARLLLQQHRFSCLLIDIYLPDMDGLEFIRSIQSQKLNIPAVVITGSSDIQKAQKAIRLGVFDYLVKPIKNRQLVQVINNAVTQYFLQQERRDLEKQKLLYQKHLEELVAQKVEELRESEIKYKNLVEQSLIGVFVLQDGRFQYLNRKTLEIFGGDSSEQFYSKNISDFFEGEKRSELEAKLSQCLSGERPYAQLTLPAFLPDGSQSMLRLWFAPIQYQKRPAIEGIVIDVTDQVKAQQREQQLELQLMNAHKMAAIGNLVAGIAHNLNNPIAIIQANAELLKLKKVDYPELDKIIEQTRRMTSLVATIVMKGKREQSFDRVEINLNELIRQELEFFEANLFFKHKIEKRLELNKDLPTFKGRYSDFSQIFDNLIDNAIDAMINSERRVLHVKTDYDQENIIFEFSDTGCGMDEEVKKRIFEPFFTTKANPHDESHAAGVPSGSGLGLSMVKSMLAEYGACIDVQSQKGKGTTFRIYIPYKK